MKIVNYNIVVMILNFVVMALNFFRFALVAIGNPFVFWACWAFFIKNQPAKIFGYEICSIISTNVYRINFVLFLLFALLVYAGWLAMLTCIFKIIKSKLNIEKFINAKLNFISIIISIFGYFNISFWFDGMEGNIFGFIFFLPMFLLKGVPIISKIASTAVKGAVAESVPKGINGWFLGKELPCKLSGNQGFDGVFLKETAIGSVEKIFITETKYQAEGGLPKLSRTKTKGLQISKPWIEKTLKAMERSGDSALETTADLIRKNPGKLVYKANVVTPAGTNKWYTLQPTKDGVIINPPRTPPKPHPK